MKNGVLQIPAGRTRRIKTISFQQNSIQTADIYRDSVYRAFNLRLSGAVQTTFGSGTPVADAYSIMDNIIPRIEVVINGGRTVKSVRPFFMAMQQLFAFKVRGERKSSAGAAAVINPTADAGFTYGTTTQYTSVAETITIWFENIMCEEGGESTWLNCKGVASAELRFVTGSFSSLLGFGNTAPVTYGNSTLQVDITSNEAQDVPGQYMFSDWKQTTKEVTFTAQVTQQLVEINRGNLLQGLFFLSRDGAAGSATTASGKLGNSNVVTELDLKLNGQVSLRNTTFWDLQAENRSQYGFSAPYASNVSQVDGVAYLDLLKKGRLSSAQPTMPPEVDTVGLYVSTRSASDVSYTNPVSLTIMTNEIVMPVGA